jgi:virginiamycin A acetyltransferase
LTKSIYPLKEYTSLVFLKHFVKASNITIGDYTYFDDRRNGPENFEEYNVLYNYDFSKVKLIIGKFCAIARETRFIMTGDHKLDAISTYPFSIASFARIPYHWPGIDFKKSLG